MHLMGPGGSQIGESNVMGLRWDRGVQRAPRQASARRGRRERDRERSSGSLGWPKQEMIKTCGYKLDVGIGHFALYLQTVLKLGDSRYVVSARSSERFMVFSVRKSGRKGGPVLANSTLAAVTYGLVGA